MLVREYMLGSSVRSDLVTTRQTSKRTWISVEDSSKASTVESTGSKYESGKVIENPGS